MNIYRLAMIKIGTTEIPVARASYDPAISTFLDGNGIYIDPTFVATQDMNPTIRCDTFALKTALTAIGYSGASLSNAELWFADLANDTATKLIADEGLVVFDTISATGGETSAAATGTFTIHLISTDENSPVTITADQTVPTPDKLLELFVLGKSVINSAAVYPDSFTLDFGNQVMKRKAAGRPWPGYVGVQKREPSIRLVGPTAGIMTAVDSRGGALTDFSQYLRQVAQGGWREAVSSSKHIKIDAAVSHGALGAQEGSYPNISSHEIILRPRMDGVNAALEFTLDTAIA